MPQPIISPAATQPVRSVGEYAHDLNSLDLQRQQMQQNVLSMTTSRLGLQDRERTIREGETIRNALAGLGPNATPEARISAMEGTNLPAGYAAADTLRKAMLEKRKVEAQAIKDEADAKQTAVKTGRLKLQYGIQSLQASNTPEDAIAAIDNGVLQGYWDKAYADQLKAGVPQQAGKDFDAYKLRELKSITDADKLLESHDRSLTRTQADTHFIRTAGQTDARDAATATHQQNQDKTAQGNLAVNQARLKIEKEKSKDESEKAPTLGEIVDPSDPTRMLKINARVYQGGSIGSPGVFGVAGKEPGAALRETKDAAKKEVKDLSDRQLAVGIEEAKKLIPLATGSGIGRAVDVATGFVGVGTAGDNAASQLETLSGWMTTNVPRMEGPQSDKDTLMYKQMAAQIGDRTKTRESRLKALETLEGLKKKYSALRENDSSSDRPGPAKSTVIKWSDLPDGR